MSVAARAKLAYLITVSQRHLIPARMLLATLAPKTTAPIYVVGNLTSEQRRSLTGCYSHVVYIDENDIDLSGRMPKVHPEMKYREWGWYKQMFLRLCIDRYLDADQVVILDSEVFVFDSWDEQRLYTPDGRPKCFYWIPAARKPDWDYAMYLGAAYPYRELPGFANVMHYAASDQFRRHISGVVLFSTENVRHLWHVLATQTDLERTMHALFNHEENLVFSDHDFYGIAMDYGLCRSVVDTVSVPELLGWYDNHDDPVFHAFAQAAPMWSMCQKYMYFPEEQAYRAYMYQVAAYLNNTVTLDEAVAV